MRSTQLGGEWLAKRQGGAEDDLRGDAIDGQVGGFQQLLRPGDPLGVQPLDEDGARRFAEAAGEGSAAHTGDFGQGIQRKGFVQVPARPSQQVR